MKSSDIKVFLVSAIPFAVLFGLFMAWHLGPGSAPLAVTIGVVSGAVFGLAIVRFISTRSGPTLDDSLQRKDPTTGHEILLEGAANHFLRGESRGGTLTLTETDLIFTSHGHNLQNKPLTIPLTDIADARPRMTLFVIPNGLLVVRTDGTQERFVVWGRATWARRIGERCQWLRAH